MGANETGSLKDAASIVHGFFSRAVGFDTTCTPRQHVAGGETAIKEPSSSLPTDRRLAGSAAKKLPAAGRQVLEVRP